jgi:hypothetical protein
MSCAVVELDRQFCTVDAIEPGFALNPPNLPTTT